jgi:hypothetical protein
MTPGQEKLVGLTQQRAQRSIFAALPIIDDDKPLSTPGLYQRQIAAIRRNRYVFDALNANRPRRSS